MQPGPPCMRVPSFHPESHHLQVPEKTEIYKQVLKKTQIVKFYLDQRCQDSWNLDSSCTSATWAKKGPRFGSRSTQARGSGSHHRNPFFISGPKIQEHWSGILFISEALQEPFSGAPQTRTRTRTRPSWKCLGHLGSTFPQGEQFSQLHRSEHGILLQTWDVEGNIKHANGWDNSAATLANTQHGGGGGGGGGCSNQANRCTLGQWWKSELDAVDANRNKPSRTSSASHEDSRVSRHARSPRRRWEREEAGWIPESVS